MSKHFPSFYSSLSQSVRRTNQQFIVLLQAGPLLFLYFARDILLALVLLFIAVWFKGNAAIVLGIISMLWLLFVLLKYNGALGIMLTEIAMGRNHPRAMSRNASQRGAKFFFNAFGAGVILFFGQILLACPCFLFLDNFIFSPFLFAYEGLSWQQARQRSKELCRGLGWFILGRTLALLLIGYLLLLLSIVLFFVHFYLLAVILTLFVIFYLGLLQSNFIWIFYQQVLEIKDEHREIAASVKYKLLIAIGVGILVLVYVIYKLLPKFL